MDARKLAELLRTGMLRAVYHGENGLRTLRELGRSYQTISKDLTRVMNRLKALYRGWGIPCAGKAAKLLRQIPCIRSDSEAARLIALMRTPHRFRSKRQLWTYSGLGIETRDSAWQYRFVRGQLQRSKKPQQLRGLNQNHNHER